MFAIAMLMATFKLNKFVMNVTKQLNGLMNIEKIKTVAILKNRLKCASFFESLVELNIP